MPIGGGRDFPREPAARAAMTAEMARAGGIDATRADTLLSRYGTRARAYCDSLAGQGETMLASLPDHAREELAHLARTERVGTPTTSSAAAPPSPCAAKPTSACWPNWPSCSPHWPNQPPRPAAESTA